MKFLLIIAFFFCATAQAASSFEVEGLSAKVHGTAERTLYHSKEKIYEGFNHVVLSGEGQRLTADYIWIDTKTREFKAKGNVTYVTKTTTVEAAEIHYNLDTETGAIFYGRVSNDYYSLKGQLIRKISKDRFLTTDGEYSTCKDCAESWKLSARNVDLTLDGYAFMESVYVKIKDIPTLYIPYLVLPIKTRRQTGLLFPRLGSNTRHGFVYVQPFYWAIDPHQDMTLSGGKYSHRGWREEGEYRYKSYNGIEGIINYYRTSDRDFKTLDHRSALKTTHIWPFAENFNMRWRVNEISDREYLTDFPEDMSGITEPSLDSSAIMNAPFSDFFVSAEAKRYRNMVTDQTVGFDGSTVQAIPTVYFGAKERGLFGPLMGSFYGRFDRFSRNNGSFYDANNNKIYDQSTDNLREADRFIFTPELSAPFRLGKYLGIAPSVQYNELRYHFNLPTNSINFSDTSLRYVSTKVEASTVFERVYAYDGKNVNRFKHQVSPFITYANIPWINKNTDHPFQRQLSRDGGMFDQFDIVPETNSTNFLRIPLGNSIYYGFTSRIISKMRAPNEEVRAYPYDQVVQKPKKYSEPKNRKQEINIEKMKLWDKYNPRYEDYREVWTLNVSQAYDFREAQNQKKTSQPDKKRAFSYLLAKSDLNIDDFSNKIEYRFYPRIVVKDTTNTTADKVFSNKHYFSTATTWFFSNLKNLRGTRSFVRSVTLNFTNSSNPSPSRTIGGELYWSLNDFLAIQYGRSNDLLSDKKLSESVRAVFTHPSECWQIGVHYAKSTASGIDRGVDIGINLMGTGFVGLNQFGNSNDSSAFGGIK